jgi:glycosyltransferase involved in cell wall biosynthesis
VHTFHGHSLEGYFSPAAARGFLAIERMLARRSDRLIAVSDEVKHDLIRLGIGSPQGIKVVPLGFDLAPFGADSDRGRKRAEKRSEWGIDPEARVVTLVARLVPIKRVDRLLSIAQRLVVEDPGLRFVVVGDGELHASLRADPRALVLGERLFWAGFERDMPAVYFASDVVVLTSDNEGTPVSLIEAQAARVPVVSTRVGGTSSAVAVGDGGWLVDVDDYDGFARSVQAALRSGPRTAGRARERMLTTFSLDRLVGDMEEIYRELVRRRGRVA